MVFSDSSLSFRAWILTHQDEGYELTEEGSRKIMAVPPALMNSSEFPGGFIMKGKSYAVLR